MLDLLKGKKTYITAGVGAIAWFAHLMGWVTMEQLIQANLLLAPLGLAFLRSGVNSATVPKTPK